MSLSMFTEINIETSDVSKLPSSSPTDKSVASTKPTSRSSSLNTFHTQDPTTTKLPASCSSEISTAGVTNPPNNLNTKLEHQEMSPQALVSPRRAKGGEVRKSPRRSSRFVEDPRTDEVDVAAGNNTPPKETPSTSIYESPTIPYSKSAPNRSSSKDNLLQDSIDSLNMDWKLDSSRKTISPRKKVLHPADAGARRKSTRISGVMDTAKEAVGSLGKRSRDAIESGVDKIKAIQRKKNSGQRLTEGERLLLEEHIKKREMDEHREATTLHLRPGKDLKDLPPLPKGWSYNVPEDKMPAAKRAKQAEDNEKNNKVADSEDEHAKPKRKSTTHPRRKKYLQQGLYVGQKRGYDPRLKPAQNEKRMANKQRKGDFDENTVFPQPMFAGDVLLKSGRNFKLPFDVFSPLPAGHPKPEEWKKIRTNRFYGDAALYWAKQASLPQSLCECDKIDGICGEQCINRALSYECDTSNCAVGPEECTNRAFASLKERYKKPTRFNVGVDVVGTEKKGFGVRACRTFDEDQVIVEYAGEIITEDECQRRMKEDYKDAKSFYLMEFDQGMIIDATKGSVARFVNHSCEPNCEMRKWIVDKKPRMALFALRDIMTGEELTYDYNFEPTGDPQPCHCGSDNCRGVIGPKSSKDKERQREKEQLQKKQEKAKRIASQKKPSITKKLAAKSEPAKSMFANAVAGTKRKLQELVSGSSKDTDKDESAKQNEDRAVRLQKRRRTLTTKSEKDTTSALFMSSYKKVPDEHRVISSSTGTTTLVNESSSPEVEDTTPLTEPSLDGTNPDTFPSKDMADFVELKPAPTSKFYAERTPSTRNSASFKSPEPTPPSAKAAKEAATLDAEASPARSSASPEHKGAHNPWNDYKPRRTKNVRGSAKRKSM